MDDEQNCNKLIAFYAKQVNKAITAGEDNADIETKLCEIIPLCTKEVFDMYGLKWMSYCTRHKLLSSRLIETFGKMIERCITSLELGRSLDSVLPFFLRILTEQEINKDSHEILLETVKTIIDCQATDKIFYIKRPIVSYLLIALKAGIGKGKIRSEVASCYLKLMYKTSPNVVQMQHTHHVAELTRLATIVYNSGNELLTMLNLQRIIINDFDEIDDYVELKKELCVSELYAELSANISASCFLAYLLLEKNPHCWTNPAQQMFVKLSSRLLNLCEGMYETVTTHTLAIIKEIPCLQLLALAMMEMIIQSWRTEPEKYMNDSFSIYIPLERFLSRKQFKKPWTHLMTNNALLRVRSYQVLRLFYAVIQPKIDLSESFLDSFELDIFQNSVTFTNLQVELDGNQQNLRPQNQKGNKDICEAALSALMTIVNTTNTVIPKPSFLRLERRILQHLLQIASTREVNFYPPPFWDTNCRLLLYKNLDSFLLNSSQSIPSGYNYGLECFVDGLKDAHHEIRIFSMYALRRLSMIIHHAVPISVGPDGRPSVIGKPCARYLETDTSSSMNSFPLETGCITRSKNEKLTQTNPEQVNQERTRNVDASTQVTNHEEEVTTTPFREQVVLGVGNTDDVIRHTDHTEEVVTSSNSTGDATASTSDADDQALGTDGVRIEDVGETVIERTDGTNVEEPPAKRARQDGAGETSVESFAENEVQQNIVADTLETADEEIDEAEVQVMLSDFVDND